MIYAQARRCFSTPRFYNQVALVTGGAMGIGRAVARTLASEGASVVIADMDIKNGKATAEATNGLFIECDTGNADQIKNCIKQISNQLGKLNILVNNAADFKYGNLKGSQSGQGTDKAITDEEWERTMRVNILGYTKTIKYALPLLKNNEKTDNVHIVDEG